MVLNSVFTVHSPAMFYPLSKTILFYSSFLTITPNNHHVIFLFLTPFFPSSTPPLTLPLQTSGTHASDALTPPLLPDVAGGVGAKRLRSDLTLLKGDFVLVQTGNHSWSEVKADSYRSLRLISYCILCFYLIV